MKKTNGAKKKFSVWAGLTALVLALAIGLFADGFATRSLADNQGKITASSAKVRKDASTSGTVLGQLAKDTVISISGEVNGTDGYIWYQTTVNGQTGYVRSDLVSKLDGSTDTQTTSSGISTTGVRMVNPVSGTISGSSSVRIRNQASTSGKIVTTASEGMALTVNGTIKGVDGKDWYLVSYNSNGTPVEGYVRSDYVKLSGELTDYVETPVETPSEEQPEDTTPVVEEEPVKKAFDTVEQEGVWYLIDAEGNGWGIQEIFDKVENNAAAYDKANKTANTLKIVLIVLAFLFVGAVVLAIALYLKMKEMDDNAYYHEVEKETMRRRNEAKAQREGQKVMPTVGEDKRPAGAAQGQPARRPAGAEQGQPARRPAGAAQGQPARRPAGAAQGQPVRRPEGAAQGQPVRRPEGAAQGQPVRRPEGAAQGHPVRRPEGAAQGQPVRRPEGAAQGQPARRPEGAAQGQPARRPEGAAQGQPVRRPVQQPQNNQGQGTANDDDDFSFEFLSDFDE